MKEKNITIAQLNKEYQDIIETDLENNITGWRQAKNYIEQSTAYSHGEPVDFLYMPKIYTPEAFACLSSLGKMTYNILGKIISAYQQDPSYRRLFPFPKELEEWILLPSPYPSPLPLARLDLFFNEDNFDFTFCEFNADGASSMNRDREIRNALKTTPAWQEMSKNWDLTGFELFHSWVKAFKKIYLSSSGSQEKPFIVITDFMESGTTEEFKVFQTAFEQAGYETEIWEIRQLKYQHDGLYTPQGRKIDAIYRRAVTGEMFQKRDEIKDFIQGIKKEKVVVIGALSTQIIHNKVLFSVIQRQETMSLLNSQEQDFVKSHFPYTVSLDAKTDINQLQQEKEKWIIKPQDLYGSRGVYAGKDQSEKEWLQLLDKYKNNGYLAQKYHTPYQSINYDFSTKPYAKAYNNITGLFLYDGEVTGILSRAGQKGVISSLHGGRTMTSVLATANK